jgi:hypothetical protein
MHIVGANLILKGSGDVQDLEALRTPDGFIATCWMPSDEELRLLNQGGCVLLSVKSLTTCPPVSLGVVMP